MQCPDLPLSRNLAFRLIFTFVAALVLLVTAVYVYIFVLNPDLLIDHIMERQMEFVYEDVYVNAQGHLEVRRDFPEKEWIYDELNRDLFYQIVDAQGNVVLASGDSGKAFFPDGTEFTQKLRKFIFTFDGKTAHVLSEPLPPPLENYTVQVATTMRLLEIFELTNVRPISKVALLISIISLLLVSVIVVFTIRYMLKPLRDASQTALNISPRNLQGRLPINNIPTELVPLIIGFNDALGRLEKGFKVQQELLATTAHELKTPLALIRGEIEMTEGLESREILLQDVDQIARQVHQLLHLAEVREAQNYQFQEIELVEVADEAVVYLARLAKKHNVKIELKFSDEIVSITADRSTLFILIKNLVENAITHAPSGSTVDVIVDGNLLCVRDYGSGISVEHFPLLFNKFWRGPSRRNEGAGLGLSICEEIAITHGWTLTAENANPGARFTLNVKSDDGKN